MGRTAYMNGILLDGTEDMVPIQDKVLIVEDEKITEIMDQSEFHGELGTRVIDLKGSYVTPGLINLHVHLPGNGGASKKPRDNKKLVQKLLSNPVTAAVVKKLCADYAAIELYSGVTTIRCVGGIADFDSKIRDEINAGKRMGPRMLVSNMALTVVGGHMEGSVAKAVHSEEEARAMVRKLSSQNVDLIKLMITGGVMDGTVKGEPGQLKMNPRIIRAACDEAHKMGYPVAAHVEGLEGLRAALENGVDTIEHGADPDDEILQLMKEKQAAVITTISPAVPYADFDPKDSYATEQGQFNGKIVLHGIANCGIKAKAAGIPVGLGNDVGCPFITQYNFWRELLYYVQLCHATPKEALYTATLQNAKIAGIDGETGSIEVGKSADFIIMEKNPLEDISELGRITGLCIRGNYIKNPLKKIKKKKNVDRLFDKDQAGR